MGLLSRRPAGLRCVFEPVVFCGVSSGLRLSPPPRCRGGGRRGDGGAAGPDGAAGLSAEGDDPREGRRASLQRRAAEGETALCGVSSPPQTERKQAHPTYRTRQHEVVAITNIKSQNIGIL